MCCILVIGCDEFMNNNCPEIWIIDMSYVNSMPDSLYGNDNKYNITSFNLDFELNVYYSK